SLWWPEPILAPGDFGGPGPGQGNQPGQTSWIRVLNGVAMAHEMGHNFGLAHSGCYGCNCPGPCHLAAIENAWAIYINGQSRSPSNTFDIMDFSRGFDSEIFMKANYQAIFDQLKITGPAPPEALAVSPNIIADQFVISSLIYDDGHLEQVVTGLANGME